MIFARRATTTRWRQIHNLIYVMSIIRVLNVFLFLLVQRLKPCRLCAGGSLKGFRDWFGSQEHKFRNEQKTMVKKKPKTFSAFYFHLALDMHMKN